MSSMGAAWENGLRRCHGCDDLFDPQQREGGFYHQRYHDTTECVRINNGRLLAIERTLANLLDASFPRRGSQDVEGL